MPTCQGGVTFSPQESTKARKSMVGLFVRCATACPSVTPGLPLGESEFRWLEKPSPQADTVPPTNPKKPNIPLKLAFQTPVKELIGKSKLAGLLCLEVFH